MKIIETLEKLWDKLIIPFPEYPDGMATQVSSTPTTPTPPPAPKPEASCFIKGVATSIEKESHLWEKVDDVDPLNQSYTWSKIELCIKHCRTNAVLRMWRSLMGDGKYLMVSLNLPGNLHEEELNDTEKALLIDTVTNHPIGQYAEKLILDARNKALREKAASYFDKLGCP